jgi:hypothetical protein
LGLTSKPELLANKGRGEWLKMVRDELPFSRQTAFRLIAIAQDSKLRDVTAPQHLPANWTILYELAQLTTSSSKRASSRAR